MASGNTVRHELFCDNTKRDVLLLTISDRLSRDRECTRHKTILKVDAILNTTERERFAGLRVRGSKRKVVNGSTATREVNHVHEIHGIKYQVGLKISCVGFTGIM